MGQRFALVSRKEQGIVGRAAKRHRYLLLAAAAVAAAPRRRHCVVVSCCLVGTLGASRGVAS